MSLHEGERLLRGPVGSKVTLTVLRGSQTDTHEVVADAGGARSPADVTGRLAAPGVGLVRVTAFSERTPEQMKQAVDQVTRQGATQMLIDLRHTSEGEPALGAEAARLFVKAGTLAIREARGQGQQKTEAKAGDGSITLPVTLLTTNGTSQAAEVFAAALTDNERAKTGRRAHAGSRGRAETREVARRQRAVADLRPLAVAQGHGHSRHRARAGRPCGRTGPRVRGAAVDRGPHPRQGPRDRRRARRPPRRPRSLRSAVAPL